MKFPILIKYCTLLGLFALLSCGDGTSTTANETAQPEETATINQSPSHNNQAKANKKGQLPDPKAGEIEWAEGAVKLSELFANKEKYNGQTVLVTGKCVKVNNMIMNRNWVHIRDGSEEGLDLTITTTDTVATGSIVSLEGKIVLDKNFGAGYHYDIIMEEATKK